MNSSFQKNTTKKLLLVITIIAVVLLGVAYFLRTLPTTEEASELQQDQLEDFDLAWGIILEIDVQENIIKIELDEDMKELNNKLLGTREVSLANDVEILQRRFKEQDRYEEEVRNVLDQANMDMTIEEYEDYIAKNTDTPRVHKYFFDNIEFEDLEVGDRVSLNTEDNVVNNLHLEAYRLERSAPQEEYEEFLNR